MWSCLNIALIKKENQIFLIYKEIQSEEVAKPHTVWGSLRKGFLTYEEMRKYFPIYEESVRLCNCSTVNFLIYEENLIIFFISVNMYVPLGRVERGEGLGGVHQGPRGGHTALPHTLVELHVVV
jgi:hypothetical protein